MSERPGSNWRHSAWKADALPTELLSHGKEITNIAPFLIYTTLFLKKINKNYCLSLQLLKSEIHKPYTLHYKKTCVILYC